MSVNVYNIFTLPDWLLSVCLSFRLTVPLSICLFVLCSCLVLSTSVHRRITGNILLPCAWWCRGTGCWCQCNLRLLVPEGRPGIFWCSPLSGISGLPVWSHFSIYYLLLFFCLVLLLFLSYPFPLLAHSPDFVLPKPPFFER